MNCQALEKRIAEIKEDEWQNTEINNQECGLASLPFTAFFADRGYRLVVQRTLVEDKQSTLFDCYVYRCILTNDWESSEREVVEFYNQRGTSERTFDMQNNDFGWKHLPFSFMKENTVFMILTTDCACSSIFLRFPSSPHSLGWGNLCALVSKTRFRRPRNRIFRQQASPLRGLEASAGD